MLLAGGDRGPARRPYNANAAAINASGSAGTSAVGLPSSQNPQPYSYNGPSMTLLSDPQASAMMNPMPQTSFMGGVFGGRGGNGGWRNRQQQLMGGNVF